MGLKGWGGDDKIIHKTSFFQFSHLVTNILKSRCVSFGVKLKDSAEGILVFS